MGTGIELRKEPIIIDIDILGLPPNAMGTGIKQRKEPITIDIDMLGLLPIPQASKQHILDDARAAAALAPKCAQPKPAWRTQWMPARRRSPPLSLVAGASCAYPQPRASRVNATQGRPTSPPIARGNAKITAKRHSPQHVCK